MSKLSRTKGRRHQSDVARKLAGALTRPFRSTQGSEARDGARGDVCEDPTHLRQDSRPLIPLPFVIECKKGKRPNIKAAMRQAGEEAAASIIQIPEVGLANPMPVAIVQFDQEAPGQGGTKLVTMLEDDWIQLVKWAQASGVFGDLG